MTVLSVWSNVNFKAIEIWKILFCVLVAFSLATGYIKPIAIIWLIIPFVAFTYENKISNKYVFFVYRLALFIYLLAMGLNLFPGFNKFVLVPEQLLGNSGTPFGLSYTLAKPIAGLIVFGFIASRTKSFTELKTTLFSARGFLNWFVPAVLLLCIGYLIGLKVDIKWLAWFPLFFLTNLTLTVVQEEAFFRSFIQQPLHNRFGKKLWILPVAALPFALVHTPHGHVNLIAFYGVLFLAGMLYAWSYYKSERLESVIATHWMVNIVHILFLTYPLTF